MAVLLISRGTMSGGELLAQCLTHTASFTCVTREDLVDSVNKYGEVATRVTSEIDRAAQSYERFSEHRRPYKILMRRALLDYARRDNLAYLGYSGHLLVEGIPHFITVRLVAPLELRLRLTMGRLRCDEDAAEAYIRKADDDRARWARFMYGRNLRDPDLYDLCLNMERMSVPTVCSLLRATIAEKELQPTDESRTQLEDEFVATSVLAALVTDPVTLPLEMGATVTDGHLRLEGPYLDDDLLAKVRTIAGAVSGVLDVDYQPGYAPAFKFLA